MNRTLAERLFKIQDAQELNNPKKDSKIWVKHLQNIIKKMNSEITRMIKMKPKDAIKLDHVELKVKEIHKMMFYPKMVYIDIFINQASLREASKEERLI